MKRRLLIVAVFLLAGAVVNVAVAWGCARWSTVAWTGLYAMYNGDTIALKGLPPLIWSIGRGFGYTEATELAEVPPDEKVVTAGWPVQALRGYAIFERVRWEGPHPLLRRVARPIQARPGTTRLRWAFTVGGVERPFPMLPVWPGFIVNTLLYAAVLWLLIPGPFVLRRVIRVTRGLCPACAYPRGESDVCSECGKALPTSRASRRIIV